MVPLVMVAVVLAALLAGGVVALVRGGGGGDGGLPGGERSEAGDGTRKPAPVRVTVTPRDRATRVALDARARVVASPALAAGGWPAAWRTATAAG